MNPTCFILSELEHTRQLGQFLAQILQECPELQDDMHWHEVGIFLSGTLGMGKTCLIHALVSTMPGAERAELSSPSFTLCNSYPTDPPILHCDVYRTSGSAPEELLDALDSRQTLVCVEWADALPQHSLPRKRLDIELKSCEKKRIACIRAYGSLAQSVLERLADLGHLYLVHDECTS